MINVTKTFLPSQLEFQNILTRVWDTEWLTNRGTLVQELEVKLKKYLHVPHLTLTANGTLPLQIAIKALELKGEIITTPFSYVATTSSIVWESCDPVFVDIHPEYLTIDEEKIEQSITSKTTAILATHVFGNPCDIERIEEIAQKHDLRVIYDAAHCFGVKYKGKSIFNYGDVSTCSFHATKIFHTGEGGCWVTNNASLQEKLYTHHNFGHDGSESFKSLGINAKMSELQAAMGLAVFNHIDEIFEGRKFAIETYQELLKDKGVQQLKLRESTEWNYSYLPIIFDSEKELLEVQGKMNAAEIYPRRYFQPSLNHLPYVASQSCRISEGISKKVLCMPLHATLTEEEIQRIVKYI